MPVTDSAISRLAAGIASGSAASEIASAINLSGSTDTSNTWIAHQAFGPQSVVDDDLISPGNYSHIITAAETYTDLVSATGGYRGVRVALDLNPAANSTRSVRGISVSAATRSGNTRDVGSIAGVQSSVLHSGSGSVPLVEALVGRATAQDGPVSALYGASCTAVNDGGAVDEGYGGFFSSADCTVNYGVYATATGGGTNYAIFADQGTVRIDGSLNHNGATVGFYSVTQAARPSAYTQTYSVADKTHAADGSSNLATTATTQTTPWGFASQAQGGNIATQFNLLRATVLDLKQLVNSVIDDLQSLGICQ